MQIRIVVLIAAVLFAGLNTEVTRAFDQRDSNWIVRVICFMYGLLRSCVR